MGERRWTYWDEPGFNVNGMSDAEVLVEVLTEPCQRCDGAGTVHRKCDSPHCGGTHGWDVFDCRSCSGSPIPGRVLREGVTHERGGYWDPEPDDERYLGAPLSLLTEDA